ncbi:hypothetical protein [Marinagarivorans cellulosilyticus]|uniref:Transposase n=1 Tax=Marinagarivorans cellulosilyticus TaxID=2721545 RepID=A0AAN2BIU5_9GAMM|nr:hypothetical protein [Marinagarivorans cellulosilyticus]BCD96287.1 hypothetical protein MARGE09_P0487 [Marinagarivorans cellulosilyticus]
MPQGLSFQLTDYIELVDWLGKVLRVDKRGAINAGLPPILESLGIEPDNWISLTKAFEENTKTFVGSDGSIERAALQMGYKRTPHQQRCKSLFG